jgi:FkbM family methyltransferase
VSHLTSLRKAEQALVHDIETWLTSVEGTVSPGPLGGTLGKAYLRARHTVLYGALRRRAMTVASAWKMCLALVLERGDTFVDVGANVGRVSQPAAWIVGSTGTVYCFEPSPTIAASLRRRMRLLGLSHVTIDERAVGRSAGTSTLHEFADGHGGASSLRRGSCAGSTHDAETQVEMCTLDGVLQLRQLKLLKIDVEGSEIDVLAGAAALVERHQPVLFVEASRDTQAAFGHTLGELIETLSALGYDLYSWRTTRLVRVVRPEDIPAQWHHDDLFGFRPGRHDGIKRRFPA